jgi:hypothetical protein
MRNAVTTFIGKAGLLCLSMLALCGQFTVAQEVWQEPTPVSAVGVRTGFGLSFADADLDDKFDKQSAKLTMEDITIRDNFTVGLLFRYSFLEWLAAGVNLDFTTCRVPNVEITVTNAQTTTNNGLYKENFGRANILSFMAVVEFKLPQEFSYRRFSPYLLLGGGVNIHFWQNPAGGLDVQVDPSLGILVGGGVEFYMNPTVGLLLEIAWYYDVTSFDASQSVTRYSGDLDLSHLDFLLGLRFYF